jgi:hypothetical protein
MMQEDGDDAETAEYDADDLGDRILDAWHRPRFAFLLGMLAGITLIGMIVFAPAEAFQQERADLGERAVNHFESRAPTGLQYEFVSTEHHGPGLYRVKMDVIRGSISSTETVYITANGKWLFTEQPEHLQPHLSN